jgi:hypothetical protein
MFAGSLIMAEDDIGKREEKKDIGQKGRKHA